MAGPVITGPTVEGPPQQVEQQQSRYLDGGQAPHPLVTCRPPSGWESYTERAITAAEAQLETTGELILTLDDATDYKITQAPEIGPIRRTVRINGGRNIVWMGGHINLVHKGHFPGGFVGVGLGLGAETVNTVDRVIHIEGLWFDGEDLSEGIDIACPHAEVHIVYCRVDRIILRSSDAAGVGTIVSGNGTQAYQSVNQRHPDSLQNFAGHRGLYIERCTFSNPATALRFEEDGGYVGNNNYVKYFNAKSEPKYSTDEAPYRTSLNNHTVHASMYDFEAGVGAWAGQGGSTVSAETTLPIAGTGSMKITETSSNEAIQAGIAFGSAQDRSQGTGISFKARLDAGGGQHAMVRLDVTEDSTVNTGLDDGWHLGQSHKVTATAGTFICNFPKHILKVLRKIRIVGLVEGDASRTSTIVIDDISQASGAQQNTFYGSPISYDGKWAIYHGGAGVSGKVQADNIYSHMVPGNLYQNNVNYTPKKWDSTVTPVTPSLQAEGTTSAVTTGVPSVTIPTHQADDILVVHAVIWAPNTAENVAEIPTPSGWELLIHKPHQVGTLKIDGYHSLFWKRATGAGTTVTLTRGTGWDTGTDTNFGARAYVIRGCRTSDTPFSTIQESGPHTTANQSLPYMRIDDYNHLAMVFGSETAIGDPIASATGWTLGTADSDTAGTDCNFQTARQTAEIDIAATATTTSAPATGSYMYFGIAWKGTSNYVSTRPTTAAEFDDNFFPKPGTLSSDGGGNYVQWTSSNGALLRNWDDSDYLKVYEGYPPEGDYAKLGVPGINYEPAGYQPERYADVDATATIATTATFFSVFERSSAIDATGAIESSGTFWTTFERTAALDATGAIASSGEVVPASTTHERSAAIDATGTIASSGVFFSVFERSTAIDATGAVTVAAFARDLLRSTAISATGAIASAPQRDLLRQAALSATGAIASEQERDLHRQAAISATGAITSAPQRDLLRQAAIGATGAIIAAGQIEGGAVTHERMAAVDATGAIASAGFEILPRSAAVSATGAIATSGIVVRSRSAAIGATADFSSAAQFWTTFTRGAAADAQAAITTAGQRDVLRSAAVNSAAAIETAYLRALLRAAALDATGAIASNGELPFAFTYVIDEDATYDNTDNWTYENEDTFSYSP